MQRERSPVGAKANALVKAMQTPYSRKQTSTNQKQAEFLQQADVERHIIGKLGAETWFSDEDVNEFDRPFRARMIC